MSARRGGTYAVKCGRDGCTERGWYEYERATEQRVTEWWCFRHRKPEEVLSADNGERSITLTVVQKNGRRYWDGNHGLVYGPGFRAIAADFEEGTQLVVSARLLYLAATPPSGPSAERGGR